MIQSNLDVMERLEKAWRLPPSQEKLIEIVQKSIAECQKEIKKPKK